MYRQTVAAGSGLSRNKSLNQQQGWILRENRPTLCSKKDVVSGAQIKNNFSAEYAQSEAEGISNHQPLYSPNSFSSFCQKVSATGAASGSAAGAGASMATVCRAN